MVIGYARKFDRSYRTAGRPSSLVKVQLQVFRPIAPPPARISHQDAEHKVEKCLS